MGSYYEDPNIAIVEEKSIPRYSKMIKAKYAFVILTIRPSHKHPMQRAKILRRFQSTITELATKQGATTEIMELNYDVSKKEEDGFFSSATGVPFSLPDSLSLKLSIELSKVNHDLFAASFMLNELIQKSGIKTKAKIKLTRIETGFVINQEDIRRELTLVAVQDIKTWYEKLKTTQLLRITGLTGSLKFKKIDPITYYAYVDIGHELRDKIIKIDGKDQSKK